MIKQYWIFAVIASALIVTGCDRQQADPEEEAAEGEELSTLNQKVSYVFGLNIARSLSQEEVELDIDALTLALEDTYSERDPRLSQEEIQTAMQTFQTQQQEKMAARQAEQEEERQAQAQSNKEAGEEFLAANAEKEGVETTDSGLQYKVLESGDGPKPNAENTVTVHYEGKLLDGTVFDSSYERGEPASFSLQQVIPGWTEGVQLMAEGATYELYVPSDLAYGPGGRQPQIGPNETLVFKVELLDAGAGDDAEESASEAAESESESE